jgi:hypothetical protein
MKKPGGWKKRTSAAKAGYSSVIYGTAEAVPFHKDPFLTQASGYTSSSWANCCETTFVNTEFLNQIVERAVAVMSDRAQIGEIDETTC